MKMGVASTEIIQVSSGLKEELVWATNKWLWVIINIMQLAIPLRNLHKNKATLNLKQYSMYCMWSLITVF